MTAEEINNMKYKVCCPLCDNDKCVRGTDNCETEMWAKQKRRVIMMTLDEAIKHCEEVAEKQRSKAHMYDDMMVYNQTIKHNSEAEYYEELMNECYRWVEEYRQLAEWLRELKKDREILDGLSIYFQSLVVDSVINQRPLMFDMRDATNEERESVKRYIADSAKTTGVNFWSIIGEVNADG